MESAVAFAKALADSTRLRIVAALREHELCVCELCDALKLSQSTLSTHLTLLRESGVVETRKDGKWIYYAVAPAFDGLIGDIFAHFDDIASDRSVGRDSQRVKARLKLRQDGRCTLGFDQLDRSRKHAA